MEKEAFGNIEQPRTGNSWLSKILLSLGVLAAYILFLLLVSPFLASIAKPYQVPSGSMLPTIQIGDRILVNRMIFNSSPIERSDVIAFNKEIEGSSGTVWIKRVVGLSGDTVEVRGGHVLVNNTEFIISGATKPDYVLPTQTVPEGMLFVLGDNRNESSDSHTWGFVSESDVTGRVDFVYWSLAHLRALSNTDLLWVILLPVIAIVSIFLLPVICAITAVKRNRHAIGWFFLGFLCGVIPLIILILLPEGQVFLSDIPENTLAGTAEGIDP